MYRMNRPNIAMVLDEIAPYRIDSIAVRRFEGWTHTTYYGCLNPLSAMAERNDRHVEDSDSKPRGS